MSDKTKGPSLIEQLQPFTGKAKAPEIEGSSDYPVAPSRRGKRAITMWADPLVADQLKEIAFHNRVSQQSLMNEALNLLFEKYGRSAIA